MASFVTTPILIILHNSKGIGSADLPAPQAQMFKGITEAFFGGQVPWTMLIVGGAVAALIIVVDEITRLKKLSFRFYVMPLAIGIYLPFYMAVPILIGGVVRALFGKKDAGETDKGILVSSGLIAGEALTGIVIAAIIFAFGNKLPNVLFEILAPVTEDPKKLEYAAGLASTISTILGAAAFIAVVCFIAKVARSTGKNKL